MSPNGSSEFVPGWMAELGVKAGPNGWLNMSKAQLRVLQRPDQALHVQVWATGMLHAPGYNGQEAIISRGAGKKGPLTPGDIIKELFGEARKYYAAAGIKPTDAELGALKETKEHIRRALVMLEEYGVVLRTDGKGTPLRDLPIEQLRRLPSGRTRMFFWLVPRDADPDLVRREWERRQPATMSRDDAQKPEVAISRLPLPPIWKILNVLQIERPEKAEIATPEYQKKVELAWHAARKVFLEVVAGGLPEVVAPEPPEVAAGRGALESKGEMKPLKETRSVSQSVERQPTDRPTDSFASRDPEKTPERMAAFLLEELGERFPGQMPGQALCVQVVEALGETPWEELWIKLQNRRWKASDVMGIVLSLAREVRARWISDAGKRRAAVRPEPIAHAVCPKCQSTGLLNGQGWQTEQDLSGVRPDECCDCEVGRMTLDLLESCAVAAGGGDR